MGDCIGSNVGLGCVTSAGLSAYTGTVVLTCGRGDGNGDAAGGGGGTAAAAAVVGSGAAIALELAPRRVRLA